MKKSQFFLLNQKLIDIKYLVNESFSFPDNQIPLIINSNINLQLNESEKTAIIKLTLNVFDEKEISKYPFFLTMTNIGIFKWDENIDKKILDVLLKSNAPAILLSYLRPLVTQFTSFSNFPPLILPLIDFSVEKAENT